MKSKRLESCRTRGIKWASCMDGTKIMERARMEGWAGDRKRWAGAGDRKRWAWAGVLKKTFSK